MYWFIELAETDKKREEEHYIKSLNFVSRPDRVNPDRASMMWCFQNNVIVNANIPDVYSINIKRLIDMVGWNIWGKLLDQLSLLDQMKTWYSIVFFVFKVVSNEKARQKRKADDEFLERLEQVQLTEE